MTLSLGARHSLTASQTDPSTGLSTAALPASYTAYSPPNAPTLSASVSGFAVTAQGTGVAGDTVAVSDGGTLVNDRDGRGERRLEPHVDAVGRQAHADREAELDRFRV